MKIISHILPLILQDVKPDAAYAALLFATLIFKVGWLTLIAFLSHAIQLFTNLQQLARSRNTGRLALCHQSY